MADIAATLAADFLGAQGWCCICIAPQTVSAKVLRPTSVTVGTISDRDEPGIRVWMQRKQADKTMAAFLSRDQRARRRPRCEGLIVDAGVNAVLCKPASRPAAPKWLGMQARKCTELVRDDHNCVIAYRHEKTGLLAFLTPWLRHVNRNSACKPVRKWGTHPRRR